MSTAQRNEQRLDRMMLRAIDGEPWSRVEFEERCRLRTLARFGVRVTRDEHSIVHVDWATVPQEQE